MVTWKRDPSHSWPHRQQDSSPPASGTPDHDRHSAPSEAAQDAVDLAQAAEAALAPGEIEADGSQDDAASRLQADQLVIEAILEEGLDGSRHRELQNELIRYAVPVVRQLLADGRIISKSTKLGRPPSDSLAWLDFTQADREELAYDMVADAVPMFTKAVFETRTWSPDPQASRKTASLKTYFVNACVLQFPALYRKWLSQRRTVLPAGLQVELGGAKAIGDTSEAFERHEEAARQLRRVADPQIQKVLALRAIGYTAAEAAQHAGLTEKAAESKQARLRKALRQKPEPPPATGDGTPAIEDGGRSDMQEA